MKTFMLLAIIGFVVFASPVPRGRDYVPAQAAVYRARLVREVHSAGGLSAPVVLFAAQIHQESRWRTDAQSVVGAMGLAQFMPGTASWIANLYPADLKPGAPLDPDWALRALVRYDYWLYARLPSFEAGDERWAAALSSYNGGLGWLQKETRLAEASGCVKQGRTHWFDCVAGFNSRSQSAWIENRGYPERILHRLRPLYVAAGW